MQTELDFYSSVSAQFGSGGLEKVVNPPFNEPRSLAGNSVCHSERSEESLYSLDSEILRLAQGDRNRLSGQASRYSNYFGKKSNEKKSLTIPISAFPIACKCPKLFAHGIMPNGTYKLNFHKSPVVFSVGSLLDKYARRFVACLHLDRVGMHGILRAELKAELLKLWQLVEEPYISFEWLSRVVSSYLDAFDNFCDIFKNAQLAELPEAITDLEFTVQAVKFRGKVDLLLKSKNKGKYILIDLKLEKFDDELSSFKFQDHIQAFVYAHILLKRGVDLEFVGYYYFMENMLILNSVSPMTTKTIKSIVGKLSYYLNFARKSFFEINFCELQSAAAHTSAT